MIWLQPFLSASRTGTTCVSDYPCISVISFTMSYYSLLSYIILTDKNILVNSSWFGCLLPTFKYPSIYSVEVTSVTTFLLKTKQLWSLSSTLPLRSSEVELREDSIIVGYMIESNWTVINDTRRHPDSVDSYTWIPPFHTVTTRLFSESRDSLPFWG